MVLFLIAGRWLRRIGRKRELVLVAIAVGIVVLGAILFSVTQDVDFGVALYWAVVTATTVGYGDVTPHDTAGRIIAAGVMLTTIPIVGALFALVAGAAALSHVRRLLGMDSSLPTRPFTLVLGGHPVLARVIEELSHAGDPVVLVAPAKPAGLPDEFRYIAGDPADEELLRRCNPSAAVRALIACENDADTLVIAVAIHSLAPALEVYALTQSPRVARALGELCVTHTLSSDELVGHTLAKSLETPRAGDVLLALVDATSYRMVEQAVDPAMVSQRLSQARGRSGTLVLGVCRGDRVDLGIDEDPVLTAEDRLIVLARNGASATP
jgi:voltage-gated potassium channel